MPLVRRAGSGIADRECPRQTRLEGGTTQRVRVRRTLQPGKKVALLIASVPNGYPLQDTGTVAVKLGQLRLDADIDIREMHQATDHFSATATGMMELGSSDARSRGRRPQPALLLTRCTAARIHLDITVSVTRSRNWWPQPNRCRSFGREVDVGLPALTA